MNLQQERRGNLYTVTGYGADHVVINDERYQASLILLPERIVTGWATGGFEALLVEDFAALLPHRPEVVLLGTGARQRFPSPALLRPLIEARIGVEVMDLRAACRTYNILMGEGRRVLAALLFDPPVRTAAA